MCELFSAACEADEVVKRTLIEKRSGYVNLDGDAHDEGNVVIQGISRITQKVTGRTRT